MNGMDNWQMSALKMSIVYAPEDISVHDHNCKNLKSNQITLEVGDYAFDL
jgi:hypothetical protein